jgi:hypothetical protein
VRVCIMRHATRPLHPPVGCERGRGGAALRRKVSCVVLRASHIRPEQLQWLLRDVTGHDGVSYRTSDGALRIILTLAIMDF